MAQSVLSSGQSPASLLNTNSTGTGNYALLTGKLTDSSAISGTNVGPIGSSLAVPAAPQTIQQMLTPGGGSVNQTEVLQMQSQPATTPDSNATSTSINFSNDAYRNTPGLGITSSVSGDTVTTPRELGDSADNVASISLSSQLIGPNSNATPTSNTILSAYSRFFLQSINESQVEKYQVVETFTAYYTFFYGKRPPVYNFRGALLNDENHKWTNDLMFFYENFLRGTQTVSLGAQAIISYDGRLISGFLLNLNINQTADLNKGAAFSFDVLVTDHVQTYFSADISSLISNARALLAARQQQIEQQISQITSSVAPGKAALNSLLVTNGQQKANSVLASGVTPTVTPVSVQAPTFVSTANF
jgi:hypothetical protein